MATKIWDHTPMGDDEFEINTVYEYDLPSDCESVIMYDCKIFQPGVRYGIHFDKSEDGYPVLQVWFDGLDVKFQAVITMHYNSHAAPDEEVLREPYSSIMTMNDYIKQARRKIINSRPAWPWCRVCYSEKSLRARQERDSSGNVLMIVALGCKC